MDYPLERRDKVARFVRDNNLDGFLVTSPVNVTYLTGFSGDSSYLLIGRDRTMLVSDGRYTEQLAEECPGLPVHIRPPSQRITAATAEVLGKLGWRNAGFEGAHLTVAEFGKFKDACPTVDWRPSEEVVEKLRAIKDPSEIAQIREAIAIAERAFCRLRHSARGEDTEKGLSDRLEGMIREEGGRCGSFAAIVGVGARAALPHAPLTQKRLADGELVLFDWGASGRFYKSDLTRVMAIRTISPKLEQVYEVVLKAQLRAIEMIRPGVKAQDVDAEARSVIQEAGFGEFFSHGLGHGLGLEVHEMPALRPNSDHVLEAGMVVTVEPGIYMTDWGGVRIEDDVLVTAEGGEVLSGLPKDLQSMVCDA